ncbi:hypothetical protein D5R40_32575 [Okeania hirsuta]|uniref:Uncharacterized protein n=1 Tax=Okeania hirsuta TaxID=1458930 RepID=A0A3N6NSX7_9CYAN|nr:hypothetical protein D5R40_32575 [Okeania hirsuta]
MKKNKRRLIIFFECLNCFNFAATFIGDIGDTWSTWQDFIFWLQTQNLISKNDWLTKILLFLILIILIAIIGFVAKKLIEGHENENFLKDGIPKFVKHT